MPQLRGQTRRQTRSQTRIQALPYRPPEPRSMDNERPVPPLPLHVQRPAPIAPVSPTLPMTPMPPAFLELAPQAPGSTALPTRPSMADILNIDFECPAARLIPTVHLEGLASILGCEITSLQQQRGLVEDQLAERHARRELAKERIADVEAVMNEIGFSPSLTHELAEAQRDADVQQCELESLVWSLIHIDDQEWESCMCMIVWSLSFDVDSSSPKCLGLSTVLGRHDGAWPGGCRVWNSLSWDLGGNGA